jgi:RNA polymerase sigma factor (sigma-70 family)
MNMNVQVIAVPAAVEAERPQEDPAGRIADLFQAHHARLFRLARRLVRGSDDPLDLVQETFLRAARAPDRVPVGASNEEAWLVRVLINLCKDSWRHHAVRSRAIVERRVEAPGACDGEPGMVAHAIVWQALDRLPPRRRAILVMYELEGASIPAIAALLGVAAVTVRWHLMVGRREMARALGDER